MSVGYLDDGGKESGRLQKETRVPCGCRNQREGLGDPAQEESRAAGRLGFQSESCEVTDGSSKDRGRTVSLRGRQVWPHVEARLKGTSLKRGEGRLEGWLRPGMVGGLAHGDGDGDGGAWRQPRIRACFEANRRSRFALGLDRK